MTVGTNKRLPLPIPYGCGSFHVAVAGFFFGHYDVAGFAVFFVGGVSGEKLGYAVDDYGKGVGQGFLDFPYPLVM